MWRDCLANQMSAIVSGMERVPDLPKYPRHSFVSRVDCDVTQVGRKWLSVAPV